MDEWISVEERLPQEKRYAMVAWDGVCAKRCAQGWITKVRPYVQASVHHSNSVTEQVVVTHWMPMPELPMPTQDGSKQVYKLSLALERLSSLEATVAGLQAVGSSETRRLLAIEEKLDALYRELGGVLR